MQRSIYRTCHDAKINKIWEIRTIITPILIPPNLTHPPPSPTGGFASKSFLKLGLHIL